MIKKYKRVHNGWMRRTSRIYLKDLNSNKSEIIKKFLDKYQQAVNYRIVRLWSEKDMSHSLPSKNITKTISTRFNTTARLSQCIGKQAEETVISQHKKNIKKQKMPRVKSHIANLDSRFIVIEEFNGHFDMCIKTMSGIPKMVIPFNWTKHTNKFKNNGWTLSKSARIGYDSKGLFIDLIFEKERPQPKQKGNIVGIDIGYNCLLACSDGQMIGTDLKTKIEKTDKRKKRYHHYINTETNRHLKQLNTDNIKLIVLENLKNVKANKRGKFSRKVNRLLSFWHYAKVIRRLECLCEENGICITYKSPWKTSQRCSVCGNIDRRNRRGNRFLCLVCKSEMDADFNASRNLELLGLAGVYSLRSLPSRENNSIINV